jgi:hypothetical protein
MRMAWKLHHEWGIPAEALIARRERAGEDRPRKQRREATARSSVCGADNSLSGAPEGTFLAVTFRTFHCSP